MAEHPPCAHPGCGHPRSDHRPGYAYGKWTYMGCDTRPCKCPRYLGEPPPTPQPEPVFLPPAERESLQQLDQEITQLLEEPEPAPVDEPEPKLTDLVGLFTRENLAPVGTILLAYDAWACPSCGSRYTVPDDHHGCGPLTPVTVTITTRSPA